MNNFFEIKNATFKAGGKEKIKNLSIAIDKFLIFSLPPALKVAFLISKKLFIIIS